MNSIMLEANPEFTHVDRDGKLRMVDVGDKIDLRRTAVAAGFIALAGPTLERIRENKVKKGDVLTVCRLAGIQAAKQTASLIPLCHPLLLTYIDVQAVIKTEGIEVTSIVKCNGKTGVEMEALSAVSAALLTIYDMCKAIDHQMVIQEIRLVQKEKDFETRDGKDE